MMSGHLFGAIAATLTTICFIPQALKVVKTRDTKAISLYMYTQVKTTSHKTKNKTKIE